MGLSEIDRQTMVKLYLEKSDQAMIDFNLLIKEKRWNLSANRIYYTTFYALSALFIKDGLSIKSHRGAKSVLGQNYIITSIIDSKYASLFSKLETLRDRADYDIVFTATEDEIMKFKPQVEDFINKIKDLIND